MTNHIIDIEEEADNDNDNDDNNENDDNDENDEIIATNLSPAMLVVAQLFSNMRCVHTVTSYL